MTIPRPAWFVIFLLAVVPMGRDAMLLGQQTDEPSHAFPAVVPLKIVDEHRDGMPFRIPQGIYYDAAMDEVLVADSGNGMIGIFDSDGVPKYSFPVGPRGSYPVAVTTDKDGNIYVLNAGGSKVLVFTFRGDPHLEIVVGDDPEGPVMASGMEMGPDGLLYLLDAREPRIWVHDRAGALVRLIGKSTTGLRFRQPYDIAFDESGNFYVSDRQGVPVQVYDPRGRYLRGWGRHEIGARNFAVPSGIAVDSQGRVYVADPLRQDIKIFDSQGDFLGRFGGYGHLPGAVGYPADVAVGSDGRIYVVERTGKRFQIFGAKTPNSGEDATAVDPSNSNPHDHSPSGLRTAE